MKKFIVLLMIVMFCMTAFSCTARKENMETMLASTQEDVTSGTTGASESESETETTEQKDALGISVCSDIARKMVIPYEFFNTQHFESNDGTWLRGTGREAFFCIAENVPLMPHLTIDNGFSITYPENIECGKVALYYLDGTPFRSGETFDSVSLGNILESGTEYVAKFYVTKKDNVENGTSYQYFICYLTVSRANAET